MLLLWDALFADSADLQLLDYMCVAMLCYSRDYRKPAGTTRNKQNSER